MTRRSIGGKDRKGTNLSQASVKVLTARRGSADPARCCQRRPGPPWRPPRWLPGRPAAAPRRRLCGPCKTRTLWRPGSGGPRRSGRWPEARWLRWPRPSRSARHSTRSARHARRGWPARHRPRPRTWLLHGSGSKYLSHVFNTVHAHAYGDVGSLVDHMRAVTDLDHQRVQVDNRVERFQGPMLPN